VAHAAADVSDGLCGDLGHILAASGVGAELAVDALLASAAVTEDVRARPREQALRCVLAGGDDYELVFTAPPSARAAVEQAGASSQTVVTRIGRICATPGLALTDSIGQALAHPPTSFDHFA